MVLLLYTSVVNQILKWQCTKILNNSSVNTGHVEVDGFPHSLNTSIIPILKEFSQCYIVLLVYYIE